MLKVLAHRSDGRALLILGLTHENITRLMDNQPIHFDAAEFGFDGDIAILAGHTITDINEDLRSMGLATPDPPKERQ